MPRMSWTPQSPITWILTFDYMTLSYLDNSISKKAMAPSNTSINIKPLGTLTHNRMTWCYQRSRFWKLIRQRCGLSCERTPIKTEWLHVFCLHHIMSLPSSPLPSHASNLLRVDESSDDEPTSFNAHETSSPHLQHSSSHDEYIPFSDNTRPKTPPLVPPDASSASDFFMTPSSRALSSTGTPQKVLDALTKLYKTRRCLVTNYPTTIDTHVVPCGSKGAQVMVVLWYLTWNTTSKLL